MKQLLFDILPLEFVLENSKIYLNKKYEYTLSKLNKEERSFLREVSLISLENKAKNNQIEDNPMSWYCLNVLQSLSLFKPALNKIDFIKIVIEQVDTGQNVLNISNYDYESNCFRYQIPVDLGRILGFNFDGINTLDEIEQYEKWEPSFIRALEIIRSINLQVLYDINPLISNILVIKTQGESHGSMSPKSLTGTVYLPELQDSTLIAECFVHECLHQYLYRLEHVSSLFLNNEGLNELYYSPWKNEPRSLIMVLHGAFVFTGVLMFYHELCHKDLPEKFIIVYKERIAYRCSQVRIALDVLASNNKLTKFGNDIVQILETQIIELKKSSFYDDSLEIDGVLDHLNKFSTKNYKHVSI
jgi:hypothetical protein